ncbi:LptA/OstA family protein [Acidimangrovimonas sediminis]|uniref:LptA/OstA family protein n=1 Tax=Acidimangrovimonas sediminis TaxID=2056283 RepID=UPI000C7FCA80|nr:LptA/OstA family protein [Acidimangrovimonas sediminis]
MSRATLAALAVSAALSVAPLAAARADTKVALTPQPDMTHQPVNITSETLTVKNADNKAVFEGKVVVTQGKMTLKAPRVVGHFHSDPATGKRSLTEIDATGGVFFDDTAEQATGRTAHYDVSSGKGTILEEVTLNQAGNESHGDRLDFDTVSGEGVMKGRTSTTFQPNSN